MASNDDYEILVIGKMRFQRGSPTGGGGTGGGTKPGTGWNPNGKVWLLKNRLTDEEEARADALAKKAKFYIEQMPDHDTIEYVIVIIQLDDGSMILGPIARGDEHSAQADYGSTMFMGQIIGLVHNHPFNSSFLNDGTFSVELHEANKRPSEQPGGDRDAIRDIFNDGGNKNALRHYIIGPDGFMRKYPYDSPLGINGSVVP